MKTIRRWLAVATAGMSIGLGALFLVPFLWMILTALKPASELLTFPPTWLPRQITWDNFRLAWASGPFPRYIINSIVVTGSILALQFLTVIPAAYAFARYRFRGSRLLFALTLATLMIPVQLIFLPVYLLLSSWSMVDTLFALILPFSSSALGVFMLRQAFKQIPDELVEAARLDHAGEWRIIRKIMIPMAMPTITAFGLLSFVSHWNEYFWPLVMTSSDAARTLPIGVDRIRSTEGAISWNVVMAGNLMLMAPILIVFWAARQRIIRAFVYFGIK